MTQGEVRLVTLLLRLWRRTFPADYAFLVTGMREEAAARRMVEQGLLERAPERGPGAYRVSSKII